LLTAFFVITVEPIKILGRFLFNRVVIKIYKFYLYVNKKIGFSFNKPRYVGIHHPQPLLVKEGSKLFIFLKKSSFHIAFVVITVIFLFNNLVYAKTSSSLNSGGDKVILQSLITNELDSPEEDQLIEESFDQQATITPIEQNYLDNLSAIKPQPVPSAPENNQEEAPVEGRNDALVNSNIVEPGTATSQPIIKKQIANRSDIIKYEVGAGDTISFIAAEFGISINTILWENNLTVYSVIKPGDKLRILPVSGVTYDVAKGDTLGTIAAQYGVDENSLAQTNKITGENLIAGEKIIIPGGKKISYATIEENNPAPENPPSEQPAPPVAHKEVITAPKSSEEISPESSGKMFWPTVGHRITQYFSWNHKAVDIANHTGTPIYAAKAGVIQYNGWGKGYGNEIVIDHGGGMITRYGHLSKSLVERGQEVEAGEQIGDMGSTGWSTGPHVHFEVIINGTKYNPLNYIK
jgi:murein DD-endopeptidase MepM/ murein hydrolase activator NlpD